MIRGGLMSERNQKAEQVYSLQTHTNLGKGSRRHRCAGTTEGPNGSTDEVGWLPSVGALLDRCPGGLSGRCVTGVSLLAVGVLSRCGLRGLVAAWSRAPESECGCGRSRQD
jgi:hypothetical protein